MNSLFLKLCFILCFVIKVYSQEEADILHYPKDWRLEKIKFPIDFAKDIKWHGIEELRFSPGMFDNTSENYFTYYFAVKVENKETLTSEEIRIFLNKYYRGLCKAVNGENKFSIDYKNIEATIIKTNKSPIFKGTVNFFDSFTNGKEIYLKMLMSLKKLPNNTFLLLVSVVPENKIDKLELLHEKNLINNLPN